MRFHPAVFVLEPGDGENLPIEIGQLGDFPTLLTTLSETLRDRT